MATYEHDLLGSQVSLSGSDYRRTRAVRRGWIKGVGNELAQKSMTDAALELASELGEYHPQIDHLPLQDIRIQRAGNDRAQYEAIYRHLEKGFNDNFRVSIDHLVDRPFRVAWASEAASGLRWTPNEKPPFLQAVAPVHTLKRTVTQTSLAGVVNALSTSTNIVNKFNFSIAGINYPSGSLKYRGASVEYRSNAILDGVYITYEFEVMGMASLYNPESGQWESIMPGWAIDDYEPISTRPYWKRRQIPLATVVDFVVALPGVG